MTDSTVYKDAESANSGGREPEGVGGRRGAERGRIVPGWGFNTAGIHAGYAPDAQTGSINVPIYQSTTFAQDDVARLRGGYEYSRCGNPTVAAVESTVAALEGGRFARAFSSGMAAVDTVLRALTRPGSHLIIGNDAYGGTFRLVATTFAEAGVAYSVVDTSDPAAVAGALRPETALVWLETPTNPLLNITDIARVAGVLEGHSARLIVDNTFATPYLQRPLELGADVVVHSATKYLGGHSDATGGIVVTNEESLDERLLFLQGGVGATLGAFDAYLIGRGMKTLGVRMDRHCANAAEVAEFLHGRPQVAEVLYPGLSGHAGHEVAAAQMSGFGGMVTIRLAGGEEAALEFCRGTRLICLAESLGGVESLLEHPARMTHQSVEGSCLQVPADIVRISVGIEDIEDILADLDEALARI